MSESISISGQIQGYDGVPIFNIKVSAYHNQQYIAHTYSDEKGKYQLSIPSGAPVSLCFDTHSTLTNAKEWHPSVIANIDTRQNIVLNRFLMRVGASSGAAADIDALAAYQFCAMWAQINTYLDKTYLEYAAFRLSQMKQPIRELEEFRRELETFFLKKSESF